MSKINDAELRRRLERLAGVQPSPEATARAMDRVRKTILETEEQQARKSLGRILMNSRWGKFAVAAAVVIAVLLGLQFLGNPLGSNLTFAQVIQPILNASTATFDIIIGVEDPNTPVIHDMVMGSCIRRILSNMPSVVNIIDLEKGKILTLVEEKKEAVYTDLKGINVPNYMEQLKNVVVMLQNSPHFEVENLRVREIDGREVVGFLAKHPKAEITVWADPKTGLPVRIEQKQQGATYTVKNMQFDVPLNESLFSMEAPEGYKSRQMELDLNSATEADFVEGLRIMAEIIGDGQFPDSVAVGDFLKQLPAIEKKGKALGLSDEEDAALGTKLQLYLTFLEPFKGAGKWYYRGKGVKLGEADKAIFWYRPKGSETYRVIYGDLHIEDAAPENLPEPLDADDVVKASVTYQQWSKPDFVGTQEDLWQITASGPITVLSDVTLMKGPQGTSVMPITLPYATGVLTSASIGDAAVPFEQAGAGQYRLQLPLDKLLAGQTKITCKWTLVLADLEKEGNNVPLKSLVPVISYKLAVALEPDSGWEYVKDPSQSSWVPFSIGNPPKPMTDFGVCGIGVQKRK